MLDGIAWRVEPIRAKASAWSLSFLGNWDSKDANMASYRFLVQQINGYFEGCEFLHVPRADNEQVDALAQIGSTRQAIPTDVALQRLLKPSVKPSP